MQESKTAYSCKKIIKGMFEREVEAGKRNRKLKTYVEKKRVKDNSPSAKGSERLNTTGNPSFLTRMEENTGEKYIVFYGEKLATR